jgi:hypothetical protein
MSRPKAVHACSYCEIKFWTPATLKHHIYYEHKITNGLTSRELEDIISVIALVLNSPVDSGGFWIPLTLFQAELSSRSPSKNSFKSFGCFECPNCSKTWTSAHAFTNFKQGCKRCEAETLPKVMWLNTEKSTREKEPQSDAKPHDTNRCEACKFGICMTVNRADGQTGDANDVGALTTRLGGLFIR